jgi:hypothetical protein
MGPPRAVELTCHNCGRSFPTPFGLIEGGGELTIEGIGVECPSCGTAVDAAGVYVNVRGFVQNLASAVPTRAELLALHEALRSERAKVSALEAAAAVREVAPRLEPFLTDYFGWPQAKWLAFLASLLAAIGFLVAFVREGKVEDAFKAFGASGAAAAVASDKTKRPKTRNQSKAERRRRRGK